MEAEVAVFWWIVCRHLQNESLISGFHMTKKAAEKSYMAELCRILILLHFPLVEQGAIKPLRRVLNRVAESVAMEKELVKEINRMAECLKAADKHPDHDLRTDEINFVVDEVNSEETTHAY